jgi:hypothetical protein
MQPASVQEVEPAELPCPVGQAAQSATAVLPTTVLKVPAPHGVQTPLSSYVPATHCAQLVLSVLPVVVTDDPAAQVSAHTPLTATDALNVPSAQSWQGVATSPSWSEVPAGQSTQAGDAALASM